MSFSKGHTRESVSSALKASQSCLEGERGLGCHETGADFVSPGHRFWWVHPLSRVLKVKKTAEPSIWGTKDGETQKHNLTTQIGTLGYWGCTGTWENLLEGTQTTQDLWNTVPFCMIWAIGTPQAAPDLSFKSLCPPGSFLWSISPQYFLNPQPDPSLSQLDKVCICNSHAQHKQKTQHRSLTEDKPSPILGPVVFITQ